MHAWDALATILSCSPPACAVRVAGALWICPPWQHRVPYRPVQPILVSLSLCTSVLTPRWAPLGPPAAAFYCSLSCGDPRRRPPRPPAAAVVTTFQAFCIALSTFDSKVML